MVLSGLSGFSLSYLVGDFVFSHKKTFWEGLSLHDKCFWKGLKPPTSHLFRPFNLFCQR